MGPLILVYGVLLAIFIVPIIFITRWANQYVSRDLENRLRAIQIIINEKGVPELWRAPFIKRAAALRLKEGTPAQFARIEEKARRKCLHEMDNLIKYCESFRLTDGDDTQKSLLDGLRQQRVRWADMDWKGLLEVEPASPELAADQ